MNNWHVPEWIVNLGDLAWVSTVIYIVVSAAAPLTIICTCIWAVFRAINEINKWRYFRSLKKDEDHV